MNKLIKDFNNSRGKSSSNTPRSRSRISSISSNSGRSHYRSQRPPVILQGTPSGTPPSSSVSSNNGSSRSSEGVSRIVRQNRQRNRSRRRRSRINSSSSNSRRSRMSR